MEIFSQFVVVVIMAICCAIGYIIKHSLSFIPNKYIPLIVGILGILFAFWHFGEINVLVFCQGICSGLASTGGHELVKNLIKKE